MSKISGKSTPPDTPTHHSTVTAPCRKGVLNIQSNQTTVTILLVLEHAFENYILSLNQKKMCYKSYLSIIKTCSSRISCFAQSLLTLRLSLCFKWRKNIFGVDKKSNITAHCDVILSSQKTEMKFPIIN